MQIGEAKLLEIRNLVAQPLQVAREEVNVAHPAHHPLRLEPQRLGFTLRIERLEIGGPLQPHARRHAEDSLQVVVEIVVRAVEAHEQPEQPGEMAVEARLEGRPILRRRAGKLLLDAGPQARHGDFGLLGRLVLRHYLLQALIP